MYDNIGKKIKSLAAFIGIAFLVIGVFLGLYFLCNQHEVGWQGKQEFYKADDWIGWVALLSGIIAEILSWPLYGFGQLIEDTETIREAVVTEHIAKHRSAQKEKASVVVDVKKESNTTFCTNCGAVRNSSAAFCTNCGHKF